jgi:hypothetical protein
MADISLQHIIDLYRTPAKTENPAIESRTKLRSIIKTAGTSFPVVKTTGFLTDLALPEDDGDLHFFVETKEGADNADTPMMVCEIQGIFKAGSKKTDDPRIKQFKQLFGTKVEVVSLFRCWPEHLRDSRQPHLFQLHPVLTIGQPGKAPIDFMNRVVWPTGEDEKEMARTFKAVSQPPKSLNISVNNGRIVFKTPSKSMKKENYVHMDGHFRNDSKLEKVKSGIVFDLFEGPQSAQSIECFALKGTTVFPKIEALKPGHYEVGGLCGLDLLALSADTPDWKPRLSPILSLKKLA